MPRNIRWDESVKENTLCLVEALLLHADDEFKDKELKTAVDVEWVTENKLRVTGFEDKQTSGKRKRKVEVGTTKKHLLKLLKKAGRSLKLPKLKDEASTSPQERELDEIQTALDCLKELGVREDEKSAKNQGYWKFTLTLKHQTMKREQNLEVVKRTWTEHSKTNLLKTSQTTLSTDKRAYRSVTRHKSSIAQSQFQTLIQDKTEGFVGRTYIFDAIQTFIEENSKGYFIIIGDPGMGKSAILAKYVQDTGCIAHFNVQLQGHNRSDQFLKSICNQLVERYQLPYNPLPSNARRDGEFLGQLLDEVAQTRNGKPVVIAVDALDEVDSASYRDANILYLPPHLPNGVYFIMTRRRGVTVPFTTDAPLQTLSLLDYQVNSQRDVRVYIQNRINSSDKLRQQINERQETILVFTDKIVDKSDNNFMYLRYVLLDIENGLYKDLSLEIFPKGLQGYYDFHWQRMGMTNEPLPENKLLIVYVLAEALESISRQRIAQFVKQDQLIVQKVLNEWEQFIQKSPVNDQIRYSLYHSSFRDFLHRKDIVEAAGLTIKEINTRMADIMWEELFGE